MMTAEGAALRETRPSFLSLVALSSVSLRGMVRWIAFERLECSDDPLA
jgi:hypothetical protein